MASAGSAADANFNKGNTMAVIFVFGSNLAGRHGKGAALTAMQAFGAIYGRGEGLQGRSYAIPTKDGQLRPLQLGEVEAGVKRFIEEATTRPGLTFNVTRIGCGLAGFKDEEIAPMFKDAPGNCRFSAKWARHLPGKRLWTQA